MENNAICCDVCGESRANKIKTKTRNNKYGKILCKKHYEQMYKYNETHKTYRDRNEIIINYELNCAEILLMSRDMVLKGVALIDIEDIDKVKDIKWCNRGDGYVLNSKFRLHRFIMNCPQDKEINHINHNPLDNRKCNLEIVDRKTQMRKLKCHNKEDVGVWFRKDTKKWSANISVDDKHVSLGCFDTKEEAIMCRKAGELKYWNLEPQTEKFEASK